MLLVHLQGGGLRGVKRPNAPSSDIQTNKQTNKTRQQLLVHLQGGNEMQPLTNKQTNKARGGRQQLLVHLQGGNEGG